MVPTPSLRFRFLLVSTLPLLTYAALAASLARAQSTPRMTLEEVLATGDAAPQLSAGTVIQAIGDVPRIDAGGNVSSIAIVRDSSGGTFQALYLTRDGHTELVFRAGDPAPGVAADFVLFPSLPETPRIHDGRLTFAGGVEDAAAGTRIGIWSEAAGSFEPLVLAGDPLPGLPADGEVSSFDFTTRGGIALLRASFTRSGDSGVGDRGLWRHGGDAWKTLVVTGMAAPGLAGAAFGADPTGVYGPLFAYDARADGKVLVQAWVRGSRIGESNDEALWLETGSGLRILAREGDRAGAKGKTTFGPTLSTPTFGGDHENIPATVNDLGSVLFGAVLRSGKTRLNSVWTNRSGSLALVARGAVPLSGYGQGDQAPGFPAGVSFATFEQGAINNRQQLAFEGSADERGDLMNLTEAIWWDVPGTLALVAAEGRPVPGRAGAVFAELSLESLTDDGALFFSARLAGSGINAANDRALFRANPDASVDLVLAEGDTVVVLDAGGASTQRTVRSFELGRELSGDGRGVARLTFSDGSAGVYATADSLLSPTP
jgi:hypothetical protein